MKLSARGKLKSTIVEAKKGATTTQQLAAGQTAYAVIKANDVMVGVD
jgi:molybdopterin-binding protein